MNNKLIKTELGVIQGLYIGKERGKAKELVNEIQVSENYGVVGDIHAKEGKHQISLLAEETIMKFDDSNMDIGKFEANVIIKGIEINHLQVGMKLKLGDQVSLEIKQIGKDDKRIEDHYLAMYRAGIFASVKEGGKVCLGDHIELLS